MRPATVASLPSRQVLAAEPGARPGLAQIALALARTMDSTRSVNQKPAAGKLADILDGLRQGGAVRRSRLAVVRTMSESAGPTSPARLGGLGAVRGAAGSRPSAMPRTPVGR